MPSFHPVQTKQKAGQLEEQMQRTVREKRKSRGRGNM